ncbi:MAG: T9SS type A sorting domain-containing protein [Ferruginibacter sp.]|nr:T9SS type A sorting domain-containing protein [Ferruginibacter sp.]
MKKIIILLFTIYFGQNIFAQCPVISGIMINACIGTSTEQTNEFLVIRNGNSTTMAGNISLDLPSGNPTGIHTFGSITQANTVVQSFDAFITNAACKSNGATPILIASDASTVFPPNANILYFPGGTFVSAAYDFNAYCGLTLYVLVSNITVTPSTAFFSNTVPRTTTIATTGCNAGSTSSYTYTTPANNDGEYVNFAAPDNPTLAAGNSGSGTSSLSFSNNGCAIPPPNVVTPITLSSITAFRLSKNSVLVNWKTLSEVNIKYMAVERSGNASEFIEIAQLNRLGGVSSSQNYQYVDNSALLANSYYRLRIVDNDGKITYSNIVTLKSIVSNSNILCYPKLANDKVTIEWNSKNVSTTAITIIDAFGRVILNKNIFTNIGFNKSEIDINILKTGVYYVRINNDDTKITESFYKQ